MLGYLDDLPRQHLSVVPGNQEGHQNGFEDLSFRFLQSVMVLKTHGQEMWRENRFFWRGSYFALFFNKHDM